MTMPFYSIIVLKQIDVSIATIRESFYYKLLLQTFIIKLQTTYYSSFIFQIEFIYTTNIYFYTKSDIRVNSLNKILFYKNRLRKNILFCNYKFFY